MKRGERGGCSTVLSVRVLSVKEKHICIARIKGFKTGNQKLTQWLEGLGKQYENCCYLHEIKKGWIPVKLLTITPAVYNTKAGDSQEAAWKLEQIVCLPYVQASVHSCQQGYWLLFGFPNVSAFNWQTLTQGHAGKWHWEMMFQTPLQRRGECGKGRDDA